MIPAWAKDIVVYYGLFLAIGILLFLRRRPRIGMFLRLGGSRGDSQLGGEGKAHSIHGKTSRAPEHFSHIQAHGERPLNVMFNYNGHSWDAYEVLGLPAGSSPENVERAFAEALKTTDGKSHMFLKAAHRAILEQWRSYRAG